MAKFDKDKNVVNPLKMKPVPELDNLALGKLINVEVIKTEIPKVDEKTGKENDWEYAGTTIPTLMFRFKNHILESCADKSERVLNYSERVIGLLKKNGEEIDNDILESLYQSMWDRIKHIHDAFVGVSNYKGFPNLPDINEKAPAKDRAEQFTKFYEVIAESFNKGTDDKPIYNNAKGTPYILWIKLVADYNSGKFFSVPTYVGEGFIERFKEDVPPTIEIKPSDNITLKAGGSKGSMGSSAMDLDKVPENVKKLLRGE